MSRRRRNLNPLSKEICGYFGKVNRGVSPKICNICPDGMECEAQRSNPTDKQPAKVTRLNRRRSDMAESLLKRAKESQEKSEANDWKEFSDILTEAAETALAFIKQEIPGQEFNRDWHESGRAARVRKAFGGKFHYFEEVEKSCKINREFDWPGWADPDEDLKPKKHERRKRVSKNFQPVYACLWGKTLNYKRTIELTEELNLPKHEDQYHVLVIPNLKEMAVELETTIDIVRAQINKWVRNKGPVKRVGMTTQKKDGGKTIYSMGRWINDGGRRNKFLNQRDYEHWLRGKCFRSL
jgi:hypothetical protein